MFIEFALYVTHVTGCVLSFISTLDYQGYALEVCLQNICTLRVLKTTETDDVVHFFGMSIYVIYVTEFATYNK